MFRRPPDRTRLSHRPGWTREAYRAAAWINSVMAVIAAWLAWHVPFPERMDLDITGLLFMIMSLPAIGAWVIALALFLCAVYCWVMMASAPPRVEDPWS